MAARAYEKGIDGTRHTPRLRYWTWALPVLPKVSEKIAPICGYQNGVNIGASGYAPHTLLVERKMLCQRLALYRGITSCPSIVTTATSQYLLRHLGDG